MERDERATDLNEPVEPEPLNEPGPPPPREPGFIGEIVERRSWPLIAIVFVFALFLAAAPFLMLREANPYADAVAGYDAICAASAAKDTTALDTLATRASLQAVPDRAALLAGLQCIDRKAAQISLEPDRSGSTFDLVVAGGTPPRTLRMRFVREDGRLMWDAASR